jgi:hypothetical protein
MHTTNVAFGSHAPSSPLRNAEIESSMCETPLVDEVAALSAPPRAGYPSESIEACAASAIAERTLAWPAKRLFEMPFMFSLAGSIGRTTSERAKPGRVSTSPEAARGVRTPEDGWRGTTVDGDDAQVTRAAA